MKGIAVDQTPDKRRRRTQIVDDRLSAAFRAVEAQPLPEAVRDLINRPEAPDRRRDRRS